MPSGLLRRRRSVADMKLTDSRPCPERCPICGGKCFGGAIGHTSAATCGAKTIPQVHTCVKHCWGTLMETFCELQQPRQNLRVAASESRPAARHNHMIKSEEYIYFKKKAITTSRTKQLKMLTEGHGFRGAPSRKHDLQHTACHAHTQHTKPRRRRCCAYS